jgi:hypothetical protein
LPFARDKGKRKYYKIRAVSASEKPTSALV